MSQRTLQRSVTEFLSGDDRQYDDPDVQRIKRTTVVDITTKIFLGDGVYHQRQNGGVSGCPNSQAQQEPGTVADAIERRSNPCGNCDPPDYHETNDEDDDPSEEITLPLPEEKPTTVADIDPIIHTTGNVKQSAHIAARDGDDPAPLCVAVGTYNGPGRWTCHSQSAYPDPGDWFALGMCDACLAAYELHEDDDESEDEDESEADETARARANNATLVEVC